MKDTYGSWLRKKPKIFVERFELSQRWKSFVLVSLIVGLLVGTAIGWIVKPVPPEFVPKAQFDALQTELTTARTNFDAATASLSATRSELATAKATLNATVAERDATSKALVGAAGEAPIETKLTGEVKLGGLFVLSGDLATYGENEYAAALLAADQVNVYLKAIGAKWTLRIVAEDTQVKPSIALEKVESFAARGIKLLIGPLSSGEVGAIKGYCDANKILAISQSSTAPDLAIPNDYIFRFCPTDKFGQGPAIGRILYDDGIRYVIPVTRNDAWGVGLEESATKRFGELGGTVLTGIRYAPEAKEFSAEAKNLADKVASAVASYGADKVGVLHISFEEANAFFTVAREYAVLSTVKWYGSDGTCASAAIIEDPNVKDFAVKIGYPSTMFAPTESIKWEMVRQNGLKVLGREPESYSYAVYDIVWVYALSLLKVDKYDAEAVRAVIPEVAASFFGASGWIDLDENGDRKAGDYVIWKIVEISPGKYDWKIVGKYILATDSVQWD